MRPVNDFQALMQRWTSLGAYNSLHILRVAGPPDVRRWCEAAAGPIDALGLAAPAVATVHADLKTGIAAELNRPFSPDESPIRLFLTGGGADHHFGVAFDHWIADSQSIRNLMERIFANYQEPGSASRLPALRTCDRSFADLFGATGWPTALAESTKMYLHHLRAYRVPIHAPLDFTSDFILTELPDGLITRLRTAGKKLGATVNDLFLAAAAQTMDSITGLERIKENSRWYRMERDRIAFSVVMDIRPLADMPLDDVFGLFLSYYTVVMKKPAAISPPELAARIAADTRTMKSERNALRSFHGIKLANRVWDMHRDARRKALMSHKFTPILGGISNVNLTDSWIDRDSRVLDFLIVTTAGPHVPLLFTLRTIRERLSFSVTYRTCVFKRQRAEEIASGFAERLAAF